MQSLLALNNGGNDSRVNIAAGQLTVLVYFSADLALNK
jgi:hypothetical protein